MNNEFHFRKAKLLDKEIVSHLRRHSTHVLDMFKNFFVIMCIIQKTKCVEVKLPSSPKENSTGPGLTESKFSKIQITYLYQYSYYTPFTSKLL